MPKAHFDRIALEAVATAKWRRENAPVILDIVRNEAPIGETGRLHNSISARFITSTLFQIRVDHPAAKAVIRGRRAVRAGRSTSASTAGFGKFFSGTGKRALHFGGDKFFASAGPTKPNDFIRRGFRRAGLRNVS